MNEKKVLMFSLLLLVLAFFSGNLGIPTGGFYQSQALKHCPYGDVNEDGKISTRDYERLNDFIYSRISPNRDISCADLNGDGTITLADRDIVVQLLGEKNTNKGFSATGNDCQLGQILCTGGAPGATAEWGGYTTSYAKCIVGSNGKNVWDRGHPEFCPSGQRCVIKTFKSASPTQYSARGYYSTCEQLSTP